MSLESAEKKFKTVEKSLRAKPWFKKDDWQISTHPFPRISPSGVTFHVFKKNWYNDESNGIHIESHLDINPNKQNKTYITIHILHQDTIPGTKIKRKELSKPVVDAVYESVSKWPGYKFRAGKYGLQPFALNLDGAAESFETELESEVSRLCKTFGPLIDQILSKLLKS